MTMIINVGSQGLPEITCYGRAPREDGIMKEMITLGKTYLHKILSRLFIKCLETVDILDGKIRAIIILLWRGRSSKRLKPYRGNVIPISQNSTNNFEKS